MERWREGEREKESGRVDVKDEDIHWEDSGKVSALMNPKASICGD